MDVSVVGFCRKCNIGGVIYRDEMCKDCWQQAEIERLRAELEEVKGGKPSVWKWVAPPDED